MADFAIFNYQFDPIKEQSPQRELEGMGRMIMTPQESFPQKQEIFGDLFQKDYEKTHTEDVIHFTNDRGPKEYIHRHLIPPTDDMVILRVANRKTQTIVDSELKEKQVDDYQNCIVIVDNRPGIQRMLIENKKAAFRDVKLLAKIIEYTFNRLLGRYSLAIHLDHLQDSRMFWQYANDRQTYPTGFYKIRFRLPYPNLDRLKKAYEKLISKTQKSFDSQVDINMTSPNGEVRLDETDPYQNDVIKSIMEDAGGDVILYSNLAKKRAIVVGKDSYRYISISDTTFHHAMEDAINKNMFGSTALDEIKEKTQTGIEV